MSKSKDSICNEGLFEGFFREHARLLRNYLYYKFGDADEADDVVQETFVKLWNNCSKVPLEKAKAFIYTAATNLSTSIKRHEKVKLKYEANYMAVNKGSSSESPEFVALEKEYMDKLTSAIEALPDRQREAFLLNRIEKKTYKEVAEVMDISPKGVEKLMHKALLKIREQIGDI